jgi:hypothetical protein
MINVGNMEIPFASGEAFQWLGLHELAPFSKRWMQAERLPLVVASGQKFKGKAMYAEQAVAVAVGCCGQCGLGFPRNGLRTSGIQGGSSRDNGLFALKGDVFLAVAPSAGPSSRTELSLSPVRAHLQEYPKASHRVSTAEARTV